MLIWKEQSPGSSIHIRKLHFKIKKKPTVKEDNYFNVHIKEGKKKIRNNKRKK
jgi:hypothetical protein